MTKKYYDHFFGNKVSDEGLKYGRVDYHCLAQSFNHVLNNDIMSELSLKGFYFDLVNGADYSYDIELLQDEIDSLQDEIDALQEKIEELEDERAEHEDGVIYDSYTKKIESLENKIEKLEGDIYDKENDIYYYENDAINDKEIFQYFIIDSNGADILSTYTDEFIYYCEDLDIYIWGVTHWGTSWDYVLTDIKLKEINAEKVA